MYEFQEDTVISAQVFIQVFAGVLGPGIPAIVSVMAQDGTAISEYVLVTSCLIVGF